MTNRTELQDTDQSGIMMAVLLKQAHGGSLSCVVCLNVCTDMSCT